MVDFTRAAATAKRLIEKNGRKVEFQRINRTPTDTTKPWLGTTATPTDKFSAIASFVSATGSGLGKTYADKQAAIGALDVALDQVCMVASTSVPRAFHATFSQFDQILDGTTIWKVVIREELVPAGTSVMFSMGLAR